MPRQRQQEKIEHQAPHQLTRVENNLGKRERQCNGAFSTQSPVNSGGSRFSSKETDSATDEDGSRLKRKEMETTMAAQTRSRGEGAAPYSNRYSDIRCPQQLNPIMRDGDVRLNPPHPLPPRSSHQRRNTPVSYRGSKSAHVNSRLSSGFMSNEDERTPEYPRDYSSRRGRQPEYNSPYTRNGHQCRDRYGDIRYPPRLNPIMRDSDVRLDFTEDWRPLQPTGRRGRGRFPAAPNSLMRDGDVRLSGYLSTVSRNPRHHRY